MLLCLKDPSKGNLSKCGLWECMGNTVVWGISKELLNELDGEDHEEKSQEREKIDCSCVWATK